MLHPRETWVWKKEHGEGGALSGVFSGEYGGTQQMDPELTEVCVHTPSMHPALWQWAHSYAHSTAVFYRLFLMLLLLSLIL